MSASIILLFIASSLHTFLGWLSALLLSASADFPDLTQFVLGLHARRSNLLFVEFLWLYSYCQCLQPYRNPTQNPGFFNKPNLNLTRNFKTQTQPKPEFENLTQPKKNRVYFGLFFKVKFFKSSPNFQENFTQKKFFGLIKLSKILFKLSL